MTAARGRRLAFVIACFLLVAAVAKSFDQLTVAAFEEFGWLGLTLKEPFGVRFEIPDPQAFSAVACGTLLLALLGAAAVLRATLAESSIWPFYLFLLALFVFCTVWDALFQLRLLQFGSLVGQANDALTLVMSLSVMMVCFVAAPTLPSLGRVALASLCSFGAKLIAMFTIVIFSGAFNGATLALLMFCAYSFQVFAVHVIAMSFTVGRSGVLKRT
jgi:hypothetical protein